MVPEDPDPRALVAVHGEDRQDDQGQRRSAPRQQHAAIGLPAAISLRARSRPARIIPPIRPGRMKYR